VLCKLTNLRHLAVTAMRDDGHWQNHEEDADIEYDINGEHIRVAAGLPAIPPAVSQLLSLRSLRLPQHEALQTLPPELFTLSR
jgi:hypothetical protein